MIQRSWRDARRIGRLLRLLLHVVVAVFIGGLAQLARRPEKLSQLWFASLLRVLHLRVIVRGESQQSPLLLAGNHISWLDIAVLVSTRPVIFVSKAEVGRWPLIGWLSRAGDTQFIERGANGTRDLNERLTALLRDGRAVVIFPEGTTTRGGSVRRFAPRLFAGAIDSATPVQPFALRYREACAPYVDDDSMLGSLWRLLAEPELIVELSFGPVLTPGASRDAIAATAQRWVAGELQLTADWSLSPNSAVPLPAR